MITDVAGHKANKSGRGLELMVKGALAHAGYEELTPSEKKTLAACDGDLFPPYPRYFTEQVKLVRNIYGAQTTSDFYVYDPHKFPAGLVIECKWQGTQGSVDEKYVFTVMSMKALSQQTILVMGGEGARPCALRWIKGQQTKRFKYMTAMQFMQWCVD